jgi:predicted alpha/beta hydrolase family esterase
MKRVIIIHCWEGYPEYCWYQYAKKKLEENGFVVDVSQFPETDLPQMNKWVAKLEELVSTPDEEVFLVGHSIGAVTILKYLEKLTDNQKIGGAVLVAGFTEDLGYKEISNFFTEPIDLDIVKKHSKGFVSIVSDNDPYVPLKFGELFKDKLEAELIIKHGMNHFSGAVDGESSCIELPDVVDSVINLSKR